MRAALELGVVVGVCLMMGLGFMAMVGLEIFIDWVVEECRRYLGVFRWTFCHITLSKIDLDQKELTTGKNFVNPCFVFKCFILKSFSFLDDCLKNQNHSRISSAFTLQSLLGNSPDTNNGAAVKLGNICLVEALFTSAYSAENSSKSEYPIFLSLIIQYVKYSYTPNLILGTKKLVAWI